MQKKKITLSLPDEDIALLLKLAGAAANSSVSKVVSILLDNVRYNEQIQELCIYDKNNSDYYLKIDMGKFRALLG